MNRLDCCGLDGRLDTKMDQFDLCHIYTDLEKTGILGSWILRNIFQNPKIEEHLEQSCAYFDIKQAQIFKREILFA